MESIILSIALATISAAIPGVFAILKNAQNSQLKKELADKEYQLQIKQLEYNTRLEKIKHEFDMEKLKYQTELNVNSTTGIEDTMKIMSKLGINMSDLINDPDKIQKQIENMNRLASLNKVTQK